MYDELFDNKELNYDFKNITDEAEIALILKTYIEKYYDESDDKEQIPFHINNRHNILLDTNNASLGSRKSKIHKISLFIRCKNSDSV